MEDAQRLKRVYTDFSTSFSGYGPSSQSQFIYQNYYFSHKVSEALRRILINNHLFDFELRDKKILEVGCGWGLRLPKFIAFGALPQNLYGVDLIPEFINEAKKFSPEMNYYCEDAQSMHFKERTFDIIFQVTCFSAILDKEVKKRLADEMLRVLKDGGLIIWIDHSDPEYKCFFNGVQYYEGIDKPQIEGLFDACNIQYYRKIWFTKPFIWQLAKLTTANIKRYLRRVFTGQKIIEIKTKEDFIREAAKTDLNTLILEAFGRIERFKSHIVCAIKKAKRK